MKYLIHLTLNDKKSFYIQSTLNKLEIMNALEAGERRLDLDESFLHDICAEFSEFQVPTKYCKELVKYGFNYPMLPSLMFTSEKVVTSSPNLHKEMFLFLVRMGNSKFEYNHLLFEDIDIGGHGLVD